MRNQCSFHSLDSHNGDQNKQGAKSIKQKLQNLELEVAKLEKHQAIFKEAGVEAGNYKLVRINRFLAIDYIGLGKSVRIYHTSSGQMTLSTSRRKRKCGVSQIGE